MLEILESLEEQFLQRLYICIYIYKNVQLKAHADFFGISNNSKEQPFSAKRIFDI